MGSALGERLDIDFEFEGGRESRGGVKELERQWRRMMMSSAEAW